MRQKYHEELTIPAGVECEISNKQLICKKGGQTLTRELTVPDTQVTIKGNTIVIDSKRAARRTIAMIGAFMAHVQNMFLGLEEEFVYEMEICNVHFPMTVKVEGSAFVVSNFLGEKQKRIAVIRPGVKVSVSGVKVTVSGRDIESVSQTAANIEKATLVAYRDRRVFQDGIFITSKAGRTI